MARRAALLFVSVAALLAVAPGVARASAEYPADIVSDLMLNCPSGFPDCTICHRDDSGGTGTVIKPFGATLISMYGLVSRNDNALKEVLAEAAADHLDANRDGVPDITALTMCQDPNLAPTPTAADGGAAPVPVYFGPPPDPTPQYGCNCHLGGARPAGTAGGVVAGALALILLARRGRKRVPAERP